MKLFPDDIADVVRFSDKPQERHLALESHNFHLVVKLIPIEPACRRNNDAVMPARDQLVGQQRARVVAARRYAGGLELEEV
jgi:hypothetical protein